MPTSPHPPDPPSNDRHSPPRENTIETLITTRGFYPQNMSSRKTFSNLVPVKMSYVNSHLRPGPAHSAQTLHSQADFISHKQKGLGVIHMNVRSLVSKLDYIKVWAQQTNADIFVFTETWLTKCVKDDDIAIAGYNVFRADRENTIRGGVSIYVKDCFPVTVISSLSQPKCYELLMLNVSLGKSTRAENLLVVGVYRKPTAISSVITDIFNLLVPYEKTEILMLGDLNLNFLTDVSDTLKDLCLDLNLTQLINVQTRPDVHNPERGSLIDLILTNRPHKFIYSGVLPLDFSDHCPIVCIRVAKQPRSKSCIITKRNFKKFDESAFLHDLFISNISQSISSIQNPDCALNLFIKTFNSVADKHAPYKKFRVKNRHNPWFSSEISELIKARDLSWSQARKSNLKSDWNRFQVLRNQCLAAIRRAKSSYYLSTISECEGNPAKFWKTVKTLSKGHSSSLPNLVVSDNMRISDKSEQCDTFNHHFIKAGDFSYPSDLLQSVTVGEGLTAPSGTRESTHTKFSFRPFSYNEVLEALYAVDPKKSVGPDNLDPNLLQLSAPLICGALTHIFNLTLLSSCIPTLWKTAFVLPLHKGGPADDLNNYRPISKLSCLAKILEQLVNKQLKMFLTSFSILNEYQSGYRSGHSTVTAVTKVVNDIIKALDDKMVCVALFIDLSKAFDSVDHNLLLLRLQKIGLDEGSCNWFSNYLIERAQAVVADGHKSSLLKISKGVPQGSILGPILFSLYINEFSSSISNSRFHLYADDTVIYTVAPSVSQALSNLQSDFHSIERAFIDLKLRLNPSKTKYIVFSRLLSSLPESGILTLSGSPIDQVSHYKYLGIWLDDKLSYKFHVDELSKKLKCKLSFLYRNRACFNLNCRKQLIQATILPVLDYGDVVYMHTTSAQVLKALNTIYHSALRFITGDSFRTHHCILYEKVGWPSMSARREYHCLLFIYKALLNTLPPYLCKLVSFRKCSKHTRSQGILTLEVPFARTDLGDNAFICYAPRMWKEVQNTLKLESLVSLDCFKKLITPVITDCKCFT